MKLKNLAIIILVIINIIFVQRFFSLQNEIDAKITKTEIVYEAEEPYILNENEYIFNMDNSPVDREYLIGERTYNLPKGKYKILKVKQYLGARIGRVIYSDPKTKPEYPDTAKNIVKIIFVEEYTE